MIVKGEDIENLRTLGSMYDNNCVAFTYKGEECRLSMDTLYQMIADHWFKLEMKRKYWHVTYWHNEKEEVIE